MSKPRIQLSDHFTYPRLLRFVAPSITMMIFTSIYGVVDGFFVSNYIGKTPFAALNFIMPFIMVLGGTGFMLGTGGSALVAKEMGCGHTERANRIFTMIIAFVVVTGLILTALGVAFIRPIARLMGASESIMADCVLYGRVTIAFTTAFMLQNVFQSFLVVAERPRVGLAGRCRGGRGEHGARRAVHRGFPLGAGGRGAGDGHRPMHRRRRSGSVYPPPKGSSASLRSLQI